MKESTKIIYEAFDGTIFLLKEDCIKYELTHPDRKLYNHIVSNMLRSEEIETDTGYIMNIITEEDVECYIKNNIGIIITYLK